MCGRFTQKYTWRELYELYRLTGAPRNIEPRYNVCPTDTIDTIRPGEGGLALVPMRWGLIPWWWKKPVKQLPPTFNARAETVAGKPMFRDAFRRGRCIIPASGYYEWAATPQGRQPYYFSAAEGPVLSLAGLCDEWRSPDTGERVRSATLIVTDANAPAGRIHDRMPVLLDRAQVEPWLSGAAGTELLVPARDQALRMWPVSKRVNSPGRGDDATLVEEIEL